MPQGPFEVQYPTFHLSIVLFCLYLWFIFSGNFSFYLIETNIPAHMLFSSNQEKLVAERRIPVLQSQLEEYKSILCQLQAQKYKLQTEVLPLLDIHATMTL